MTCQGILTALGVGGLKGKTPGDPVEKSQPAYAVFFKSTDDAQGRDAITHISVKDALAKITLRKSVENGGRPIEQ